MFWIPLRETQPWHGVGTGGFCVVGILVRSFCMNICMGKRMTCFLSSYVFSLKFRKINTGPAGERARQIKVFAVKV